MKKKGQPPTQQMKEAGIRGGRRGWIVERECIFGRSRVEEGDSSFGCNLGASEVPSGSFCSPVPSHARFGTSLYTLRVSD